MTHVRGNHLRHLSEPTKRRSIKEPIPILLRRGAGIGWIEFCPLDDRVSPGVTLIGINQGLLPPEKDASENLHEIPWPTRCRNGSVLTGSLRTPVFRLDFAPIHAVSTSALYKRTLSTLK
jgi:hypothetical protein